MHVTSVFVTHDQEEAMEVADRVVVMNEGHIEQVGTPEELYENAANPFVYQFLGYVNLFHGRVQTGRVQIGEVDITLDENTEIHHAPVIAYVRPHELEITRQADEVAISATIVNVYMLGSIVRLELVQQSNSEVIEAELTREHYRLLNLQKGELVFVKPRRMRIFMEHSNVQVANNQ